MLLDDPVEARTKAHECIRALRRFNLALVVCLKLFAELVQVAERELAGVRSIADAEVDDRTCNQVASMSADPHEYVRLLKRVGARLNAARWL